MFLMFLFRLDTHKMLVYRLTFSTQKYEISSELIQQSTQTNIYAVSLKIMIKVKMIKMVSILSVTFIFLAASFYISRGKSNKFKKTMQNAVMRINMRF